MLSTFLVSAASRAPGSFGARPAPLAAKDWLRIDRVLGAARPFA